MKIRIHYNSHQENQLREVFSKVTTGEEIAGWDGPIQKFCNIPCQDGELPAFIIKGRESDDGYFDFFDYKGQEVTFVSFGGGPMFELVSAAKTDIQLSHRMRTYRGVVLAHIYGA